jgi:hypothetical protein
MPIDNRKYTPLRVRLRRRASEHGVRYGRQCAAAAAASRRRHTTQGGGAWKFGFVIGCNVLTLLPSSV